MALSDDDARDAYAGLADILDRAGLNWIRVQVEEQLALGKLSPRRIKARDHGSTDAETLWVVSAPRTEPKRTATFVVAEPYSPQERLDTLVDAVLLAVPTVRAVADAAFQSLAGFDASPTLAFTPEAEVRSSYSLSVERVRQTEEANAQLVELLVELRGGSARADQSHTPG